MQPYKTTLFKRKRRLMDFVTWANQETVRLVKEWIAKRKVIGVLVLLALLGVSAQAADQRVTLTITLTNLPVTSNTLIFTAPASKTITWTNVAGSANVVTGATIAASATNLYLQLAAYRIGSPPLSLGLLTNATNFALYGEVNQVITVSQAGTDGGSWAILTLTTNAVTPRQPVVVPINTNPYATNWTNVANGLVDGISSYASSVFNSNSASLARYLNTGTSVQQVLGPKTFHMIGGTNAGLTNGWNLNATNLNGVSSNGLNIGAAFRSLGVGSNSTQISSNAQAKGSYSIAIGPDSFATNDNAVALGAGAISTNASSVAVGRNTRAGNDSAIAMGLSAAATGAGAIAIGDSSGASGYTDIAIGAEAAATGGASTAIGTASGATATNSTAIGELASAAAPDSTALGKGATVADTHTNSMAIGKGAETTTEGQIMLGSADVFLVETFARLQAGSVTNALLTGTNVVNGDISWTRYDASTFANGNNVAAPLTNVNIQATGPTADFAICGIIGGRNGREIWIENATAYVMTIANASGVDPTAANRILTPTRADITVQSNGWARLIYDSAVSRWKLKDKYP